MIEKLLVKLSLIYTVLKGGDDMIVLLIVSSIILDQYTYSRVPSRLKQRVKEVLIQQVGEELADMYMNS